MGSSLRKVFCTLSEDLAELGSVGLTILLSEGLAGLGFKVLSELGSVGLAKLFSEGLAELGSGAFVSFFLSQEPSV